MSESQEIENKREETEEASENAELTNDEQEKAEYSKDSSENASSSETNDSVDAEETPASKRLAAIILGSVIILVVFAFTMIAIMPPLSWVSEKEVQSNFHAISTITHLDAGADATLKLSYAPIREKQCYHVEIEESTKYETGESRVTIKTTVEISQPERRETEDTVSILLSEVDAHVYDGEEEIKIASAGGMLKGISLYARLEQQSGLGAIVPEANINPQVARVLYIISDAIRQSWVVLPEASVGPNSEWTTEDIEDASTQLHRKSSIRIKSAQPEHQVLSMTTKLQSNQAGVETDIGNGTSEIEIKSGRVERSKAEYTRQASLHQSATSTQHVQIQLAKSECLQGE